MLPVPPPRSTSRGRAGQPIGKATRQCDTARRVIERFAQREPVGGEPLRHPVSASANSRTCVGQPGSS